MYLFYDTETTGLPSNWKAPIEDFDAWPRMVQVAWLLYEQDGTLLSENQYVIKPNGYEIPVQASRVHGITTDYALSNGEELSTVLNQIQRDLDASVLLVAHNISFDEKVLGAEFLRDGKDPVALFDTNRICTMRTTTNYCAIHGNRGYKWPTLQELHNKVFKESFDDAHSAIADVKATASCFWELKNKGFQFNTY